MKLRLRRFVKWVIAHAFDFGLEKREVMAPAVGARYVRPVDVTGYRLKAGIASQEGKVLIRAESIAIADSEVERSLQRFDRRLLLLQPRVRARDVEGDAPQ